MNNTKYVVRIKEANNYKFLGYGDSYYRWYSELDKANVFIFNTIDKAKNSIVTIAQTDNETIDITTLDEALMPKANNK